MTPPDRRNRAIEEGAEAIFQSGILDEIVQALEDGRLDERNAMEDAHVIATLVVDASLTSDEVGA